MAETRNFQAVPIKDVKKANEKKTYFAIWQYRFPAMVKYRDGWWIDCITGKKLYGITHILIETDE